jgi:DNA-3-methyladenine glycosylase II
MEEWKSLADWLKKNDTKLAPLIREIGPPELNRVKDPFRALARSILSQQLATKAAESITKKFIALSPPFPKPEEILRLKLSQLRAAGVSAQKAGYLKSLSEQWQDPKWRRNWNDLSDDELVARLIQVKGIGEWTAHMFLIFSLARPNVLPIGDYGIRRGVQRLYGLSEMPLPKAVRSHVQHWDGAFSVGAWYLWKAQDKKLLL